MKKSELTPLHHACIEGDISMVHLLIRYGANVTILNSKLVSPLHIAACYDNSEIVQELLNAGAVEIINTSQNEGETPLWLATLHNHLEIVKILLENGAHVDGNPSLLKNKRPNVQTPLCMAHAMYNADVAKLLLEWGADYKSINLYSIMNDFIHRGDISAVKFILEKAPDLQAKAFISAATYGKLEIVKYFLDLGVPVDGDGRHTPLWFACNNKHSEVAKELIKRGANVNAREIGRLECPLSFATSSGDLSIVECMVSKGAHIDILDSIVFKTTNEMTYLGKAHISLIAIEREYYSLAKYFLARSSIDWVYTSICEVKLLPFSNRHTIMKQYNRYKFWQIREETKT